VAFVDALHIHSNMLWVDISSGWMPEKWWLESTAPTYQGMT
jgi:hypothetical protein